MQTKRILLGATGASGSPLLLECLRILKTAEQYTSALILSAGAEKTLLHETGKTRAEVEALADECFRIDDLGAKPASGSYATAGMCIVPCSMKTIAGIWAGYAENLLLRAADVTIKEKRPLVLAPREMPLSAIHLRNLHDLSLLPNIHILPPMMTYYHRPQTLFEMTHQVAARLLLPFGIEAQGFFRWAGL